jgi:hypothetical protein
LNPRWTFQPIRDFQSRSLDRSDTSPSESEGIALVVRVAGPPEAGFAGREAHVARQDHHPRRRLLKRQKDGFVVKERAHGGTRVSP